MSQPKRDQLIADLRACIRRIEQGGAAGDRYRAVLPFDLAAIADHLPAGGLDLGALHKMRI